MVEEMGLFGSFLKPNVEKMEKDRDVEGLITALKHKDVCVRLGAAAALARIGDARGVGPLTQALKDGDVRVQKAMREALEKIKAKKS